MRNQKLDTFRGLAMMWVVFNHTTYWLVFYNNSTATAVVKSLFLLGTQLFFFIAGASNGMARKKSIPEFYLKRFKRILVPYWVYGIICLALTPIWIKFYSTSHYLLFLKNSFYHWFVTFNNQNCWNGMLTWALWFVPVYLLVMLLFPFLRIYFEKNTKLFLKAIPLFVFALLVFLFQYNLGIGNPLLKYCRMVSFYGFFAYFGLFFTELFNKQYTIKASWVAIVCGAITILSITFLDLSPDMQDNKFPPNFLFLVFSLGMLSVLYIFSNPIVKGISFFRKNKTFDWIFLQYTKHGVTIFLFHAFLLLFLYWLKRNIFFGVNEFVVLLIMLCLSIPLSAILGNIFSWVERIRIPNFMRKNNNLNEQETIRFQIRKILSKSMSFFKSYIELSVWLLIFAVGIRFFEAVLLSQFNNHFGSQLLLSLTGLGFDILVFFRHHIWLLIIFIPFCFSNEKISRITYRILLSLMLLFSLICITFFATSGFLLDRVILNFTFEEMITIVQSSSRSPLWVYATLFLIPVSYFYFSSKRIKINKIMLISFIVLTVSSFFIKPLSTSTNHFHTKTNKFYFFANSALNRPKEIYTEKNEDIIHIVSEFRSFFPEHQFLETEYPFLHKETCKDVLSPFFDLKETMPNLVFIIVEGLGYEIAKPKYGIMPFLDSLSQKSLRWENCFSVSPRTFGVLPALFGAAPLGENGFMAKCPNNPDYNSLLRILHKNKYTQNLFYGGWMAFDNMNYFAEQNKVSYLKDNEWDKDIEEQKMGAYWGVEDHLTYMQAHRKLNIIKSSPRTEIYLSLSTHDPFEYPNSDHFQEIVKNNIALNMMLTEKEKNEILQRIEVYGGFSYADWSLQQLMFDYSNRDDFENTIFIITGDHSPFPKQFGGYSNYHVPLIIYSPMLTSGRNMKGVVSHRDITPTLLSLLQNNYPIISPQEVSWLNTALDTSLTFNAQTFSPLQTVDRSVGGVLYQNYLFCEDIIEEITDAAPRKIENPTAMEKMNDLLALYKFLDLYAFNNDALIRNYHAHAQFLDTLLNIYDTISPTSYFANKSYLKVVNGPEKHVTTLHFDSSRYYPIEFINFNIPENIELLKVDIEFKIYIKSKRKDCLTMVMDLSKASYNVDYFTPDKYNRWYTYKNTVIYRKDTWEHILNNCYLKFFLSNSYKIEGYIDDICVVVTVSK